ncbi:MAG: hypothetical protein P1U68_06770 [Verrucomicrobiales bacterium]|nr:hypothetical protein [Verrucomicrobiales bacterium]
MSVTESSTTAERAYFYYLERQRLGLPGNEGDDWLRAEATATKRELPVTAIKGIGPKVATELGNKGVSSVAQLATWSLSDFGEKLPRLTARAKSGRWIEQAHKLS